MPVLFECIDSYSILIGADLLPPGRPSCAGPSNVPPTYVPRPHTGYALYIFQFADTRGYKRPHMQLSYSALPAVATTIVPRFPMGATITTFVVGLLVPWRKPSDERVVTSIVRHSHSGAYPRTSSSTQFKVKCHSLCAILVRLAPSLTPICVGCRSTGQLHSRSMQERRSAARARATAQRAGMRYGLAVLCHGVRKPHLMAWVGVVAMQSTRYSTVVTSQQCGAPDAATAPQCSEEGSSYRLYPRHGGRTHFFVPHPDRYACGFVYLSAGRTVS
jgi:hypothetical protein